MDIGISAEADLRPLRTDVPQRTVTGHILAVADQAGFGAALIDAAALSAAAAGGTGEAASVITWPQFAHMVRAAARGLSRRGLREGDTAGIFVQDAISHAVAVHAVRAAGAIALGKSERPAEIVQLGPLLHDRRAGVRLSAASAIARLSPAGSGGGG